MKIIEALKQCMLTVKKYNKKTFANTLKGTEIGNSVFLDDVSPFEHDISVKASGVDDPSLLTLYKQGKNLLRFDDGKYTMSRYSAGVNRTVTITLNNSHMRIDYEPTSFYDQSNWISAIKPFTTFYLPAGAYKLGSLNTVRMSGTTCTLQIINAETGKSIIVLQGAGGENGDKVSNAFTLDKGLEVYFYCYLENSNTTKATFDGDIVLYKSTDDFTSFEPHITPVSYMPNSDGTVEGVTSLYPNTTLYTDRDVALIECEYIQDANKVIEKLTNAITSLGGNI